MLDIDQLVSNIINSGLSPEVFEVDLDIPRAKNVLDFALGHDFLGHQSLFAIQAEQAVKLFAEFCPACSDPEYLMNVPVGDSMDQFMERVQMLDYSVCPSCHKNKRQLFDIFPNELVSCIGQRAGKTAVTGGVIIPYITHRYLKIPSLISYLGLMPNSSFQMTMVAISAGQVRETLWASVASTINSSPWFKEYHNGLKEQEKLKGFAPGTLHKSLDSFIWYGNQRITISYQAANMKTLRGRTRLVGAIDEIGWMPTNENAINANAHETYTALARSLISVRGSADLMWRKGDYDVPTAYMLNISSPSSQYDKIMSLLKESKRDNRKVAFHYASWEASPRVPRESVRAEELSDPIGFWRDLGAEPPLANKPLITNQKAIYATNSKKTPLFQTQREYVQDKAGSGKFVAAKVISCDTDKQTARIITCDAGEVGNSFAISLHHIEKVDDVITVVCDGAVSVAPERIIQTDTTIPIHFPTMFDIVLHLCKNFNILYVVYDRWQSTGEIQRLRDLKIVAEKYSPKFNDFIEFRNLIDGGRYKMPRWELEKLEDLDMTDAEQVKKYPYMLAALQIGTVREIGNKIAKPEAGDDDIFRTIILAVKYLEVHSEKFLKAGLGNAKRSLASLGVVFGRSTGYTGRGVVSGANAHLGNIRRKTGLK